MTATLRTPFCDLLGIDVPIVQAPIGEVSCPALAAAVSNAGGLGMLSATWRTPEETRRVIRETRELTDRPFGVNLVLEWPQEERVRICLEEGVGIVSFFWGDPSPYLQAVHAAGATAMHTVASAAEARAVANKGVDVVVAQGWEAGGHVWGKVSLFPLVPAVVDAVRSVPVIAAGGIADGRGLAAALALGASGVWCGTRFVLSDEAWAHPEYQHLLMSAAETDTLYSTVFDELWVDAPARTVRNSTTRLWEEAGAPPREQRPGQNESLARTDAGESIERYSDATPTPAMTGAIEAMALYAGQSVGLISAIQPAGDIVRGMVDGATQILARLAQDVQGANGR